MDGMSEYERLRLENIAKNNAILAELHLGDASLIASAVGTTQVSSKRAHSEEPPHGNKRLKAASAAASTAAASRVSRQKRKKERQEEEEEDQQAAAPRRMSLRIRGLAPDKATPEQILQSDNSNNSGGQDHQLEDESGAIPLGRVLEGLERIRRSLSSSLTDSDQLAAKNNAKAKAWLHRFYPDMSTSNVGGVAISDASSRNSEPSTSSPSSSSSIVKGEMRNAAKSHKTYQRQFRFHGEIFQRYLSSRITHCGFHPSESVAFVAASDTSGNIGLLNLDQLIERQQNQDHHQADDDDVDHEKEEGDSEEKENYAEADVHHDHDNDHEQVETPHDDVAGDESSESPTRRYPRRNREGIKAASASATANTTISSLSLSSSSSSPSKPVVASADGSLVMLSSLPLGQNDDNEWLDTPFVVARNVHTESVSGLAFAKDGRLFSSGYDGVVRMLDLTSVSMQAVFRTSSSSDSHQEEPISCMSLDRGGVSGWSEQQQGGGAGHLIWVGGLKGSLWLVDTRMGPSKAATHLPHLHAKKIGSLSTSPACQHMLLSASNDRTACIWDVRKMSHRKSDSSPASSSATEASSPSVASSSSASSLISHYFSKSSKTASKPSHHLQSNPSEATDVSVSLSKSAHNAKIHEFVCGKSVTSAHFSPLHPLALITSRDDTLRVCADIMEAKASQSVVRHDNNTGRFVTQFRARWMADGETFMVGSMNRSLSVYRYDNAKHTVIEYQAWTHPDLSSIPAINSCHPTMPWIVSANSSGKVALWRSPLY